MNFSSNPPPKPGFFGPEHGLHHVHRCTINLQGFCSDISWLRSHKIPSTISFELHFDIKNLNLNLHSSSGIWCAPAQRPVPSLGLLPLAAPESCSLRAAHWSSCSPTNLILVVVTNPLPIREQIPPKWGKFLHDGWNVAWNENSRRCRSGANLFIISVSNISSNINILTPEVLFRALKLIFNLFFENNFPTKRNGTETSLGHMSDKPFVLSGASARLQNRAIYSNEQLKKWHWTDCQFVPWEQRFCYPQL